MKVYKLCAVAVAITIWVGVTPTDAKAQFGKEFGLPNIGGALSGADGGAVGQQDDLIRKFTGANNEIVSAQINFARAFELEEQATLLEAEQAAISSGSVSTNDLKKVTKTSESVNKEIREKLEGQEELSAEGKAYFASGLPHLVKGVYMTTKLPADATQFANSAQAQISSGNLLQKATITNKLGAGLYVVKELPSFSKDLFDTFKLVMAFSEANNIDVPDDATSILGDL